MALFTHGRGELISMLASVEGSVARLTQICERAFSKRQTYKDQLRDSEAVSAAAGGRYRCTAITDLQKK